ncbi:hypothetical protein Acr_18g0002400 [Actinidia rufa]|uniref:NB-ARC domain-containing disease resistance protein n=1 Tax=Actinidia rufa TaxID=165716 RepID=A0A7J0G5K5_9ERIC|nr:hypothetical protein Acr_18g0002400 [Actinidia rufa]
MADAAVSFLLEKISSLVGREWDLLKSIDGRVDNFKRELKTIKALLTDAADARGEENAQFREWIQQVRDLAYAIDDVLDTFILHLAKHPPCVLDLTRWFTHSDARHLIDNQIQEINTMMDSIKPTKERSKAVPKLLWDIFNQLSCPTAEPTPLSSSQFNKVVLLDKLLKSSTRQTVQPLPQEKARELFYKKAFPPSGICPRWLVDRSKSILEKCEGLPLGIIEIGKLLSNREKTESEWKRLHDGLESELKREVSLSYTNLPYLKSLYLSNFPEFQEADLPFWDNFNPKGWIQHVTGEPVGRAIHVLFRDTNTYTRHSFKLAVIEGFAFWKKEMGQSCAAPFKCSPEPPVLEWRLRRMPNWISKLHDLVRIRLKWSRLTHDPIPILQDLPNLLELQLLDAYTGSWLNFNAGKFQTLKILEFELLEQLEIVILKSGSMPGLQKLIIRRCDNLKQVPVGIENLTHLKELDLYDKPHFFVNPLQKSGGELRHLVCRIPKIHSYSRNREGSTTVVFASWYESSYHGKEGKGDRRGTYGKSENGEERMSGEWLTSPVYEWSGINTVTWNTIIAGYSKLGPVEMALQVFDRMRLRDLASSSAMITGHVNNGHWGCGLLLFRDMNALEELKPDQLTLGSILAGCAHMDSTGLQIMSCTAIK